MNTHTVLADSVHDGIDDFPSEPRAALFIPAPSIRVFVGHCLKELIGEVTVCIVNLHPVKSGTVYNVACRFCVHSNVILDLVLGQ